VSVDLFDVPVRGGSLRVARWEGDGPPVLALHGITATHMEFVKVAEHLDGAVQLVAPDLRGRGGSNPAEGPWGMDEHAHDMIPVLDAIGAERAVVVGHSMGGYVAGCLAEQHGDRVSRVILVDGGFPPAGVIPPDGEIDPDAIVDAFLGPSMARLSMTFPSRKAYFDFWRSQPALAQAWGSHIEAYFDYDLVGAPPELRSSVAADAIRGDTRDQFARPHTLNAIERTAHPTVWMRAERGMLDEPPGIYPDDYAAEILARNPHIAGILMAGVNHFTSVMSNVGGAMVAEQIIKAAVE
jgi:pimeloyl-ACP methyl ester carboxylesterase